MTIHAVAGAEGSASCISSRSMPLIVSAPMAGEVTMLRSQPDVKFDTGNEEESRGLPGLPAACRPARRVLAPFFPSSKPSHGEIPEG